MPTRTARRRATTPATARATAAGGTHGLTPAAFVAPVCTRLPPTAHPPHRRSPPCRLARRVMAAPESAPHIHQVGACPPAARSGQARAGTASPNRQAPNSPTIVDNGAARYCPASRHVTTRRGAATRGGGARRRRGSGARRGAHERATGGGGVDRRGCRPHPSKSEKRNKDGGWVRDAATNGAARPRRAGRRRHARGALPPRPRPTPTTLAPRNPRLRAHPRCLLPSATARPPAPLQWRGAARGGPGGGGGHPQSEGHGG